jgi:hypothetical protein
LAELLIINLRAVMFKTRHGGVPFIGEGIASEKLAHISSSISGEDADASPAIGNLRQWQISFNGLALAFA